MARELHTLRKFCVAAGCSIGRARPRDPRPELAGGVRLWRLLGNACRAFGARQQANVVDVLPIQLQNLRRKLTASMPVTLYHRDSTALGFDDCSYDQAIIFFLLHEQPLPVRKKTLAEALRVIKPGGKLVIVTNHRPAYINPLRYLLWPPLRALEPSALDLWNHDIGDWLPSEVVVERIRKRTFCGGLYQKLVIRV